MVFVFSHPEVESVHYRDAGPDDQPQPGRLLAVAGLRCPGCGLLLATTETIFGTLIFLGYWSPKLGILGALGSIVTFIGTTTIIPFLPDAWAQEAGGFPIMTLPLGFLMKDVLFLAASFYLLKQDLVRAAMDIERS